MEKREGDINLLDGHENLRSASQRATTVVRERAADLTDRVKDSGNAMLQSVGSTISSAADTLEKRAPSEGRIGSAAKCAADTLKSTGENISNYKVENVVGDTTNMIKRYPLYAVAAGIGLGYFVRSFFSRRN